MKKEEEVKQIEKKTEPKDEPETNVMVAELKKQIEELQNQVKSLSKSSYDISIQ